jgi:hypothetical protein
MTIRMGCGGKMSGDEIEFTREVAHFATEEPIAERAR